MLCTKCQDPVADIEKAKTSAVDTVAENPASEVADQLSDHQEECLANETAEAEQPRLAATIDDTTKKIDDEEDAYGFPRKYTHEDCLWQYSTPYFTPQTIAYFKSRLFSIRRNLPVAVVQTLEEELRTDGPIQKIFKPVSFYVVEDPESEEVGSAIKRHIRKAAAKISWEKSEVVLDKWLGKTARERRISFEVLGQLSQLRRGPDIKKFPTNHELYVEDRADMTLEHLSIEDAKELCEDWNPISKDSELYWRYNDLPSSDELTVMAKRFVDMLGDGLEPGDCILPRERWSVKERGWSSHGCGCCC